MSIVTKNFDTREEAEAAQARLVRSGFAPEQVKLRAPVDNPGMFDHFSSLFSGKPQTGYHLSADIPPQRVVQARLVLEGAPMPVTAPSEQVFEFPEMREELRIEKQPFVREEVQVSRRVRERLSDIEETVRHTEVEIEEIPPEPEAMRFGLRDRPQ